MHKETITYTDYNGNQRTETFYFNLSKAEALEMECSVNGGLTETMTKMVETQNLPGIFSIFKQLVLKAYGEKSPDGRRLIKSDEISKAFTETEAYSQLFMRITSDTNEAAKFFSDIVPDDNRSILPSPDVPAATPYEQITGNK